MVGSIFFVILPGQGGVMGAYSGEWACVSMVLRLALHRALKVLAGVCGRKGAIHRARVLAQGAATAQAWQHSHPPALCSLVVWGHRHEAVPCAIPCATV